MPLPQSLFINSMHVFVNEEEAFNLNPSEEAKFSKFLDDMHIHGYLASINLDTSIFYGFLIGVELSIFTNFGFLIGAFSVKVLLLFLISLLVGFLCWVYNKYYFHNYVNARWVGVGKWFKAYSDEKARLQPPKENSGES